MTNTPTSDPTPRQRLAHALRAVAEAVCDMEPHAAAGSQSSDLNALGGAVRDVEITFRLNRDGAGGPECWCGAAATVRDDVDDLSTCVMHAQAATAPALLVVIQEWCAADTESHDAGWAAALDTPLPETASEPGRFLEYYRASDRVKAAIERYNAAHAALYTLAGVPVPEDRLQVVSSGTSDSALLDLVLEGVASNLSGVWLDLRTRLTPRPWIVTRGGGALGTLQYLTSDGWRAPENPRAPYHPEKGIFLTGRAALVAYYESERP